jgi:hypothetical protein
LVDVFGTLLLFGCSLILFKRVGNYWTTFAASQETPAPTAAPFAA